MTIIMPDALSTPDSIGTTTTHRVRVRRRACPPWCVTLDSGEDHRHGRPASVWVPRERVTLTVAPLTVFCRYVEIVATPAATGRPAVVAEWPADQVPAIVWALSHARCASEYPRAVSHSTWCDLDGIDHDVCVRWYPVIVSPVLWERVPVVRLEAPRRRYARQRVAFGPAGRSRLYRLTADQVGALMDALTTAAGTGTYGVTW